MPVTEYKCPCCGAPLAFAPGAQKVRCESCDTEFTLEAIQAMAKTDDESGLEFDWGNMTNETDESQTMEGVKTYQCESCGAIIEADENTAATTCPYCGNNVVLKDRVSDSLKPNAIIPFKIQKKDLPDLLKRFYKKKKLLPGSFFTNNNIGKAQGVYVPFWLFDASMDGDIGIKGSKSHSHREGQYDVTVTEHYMLERSGRMDFKQVPVDASLKMDNALMDSIEPYDFSELTAFDSAYLSGFVADKYDSKPEDEIPRAEVRMSNSAVQAMESTTGGYSIEGIEYNRMKMVDSSVKYAFLPVYLLNCEYGGKKYQYAVNGQTGKVVGELPISAGKTAAYFFATAAIVSVVGALLLTVFGV